MTEERSLTQTKDPGFWREMWQQVRLVVRLVADPEVPFYLKILPFVSLVYLVIPVDLLWDFAPVLGQLDDITILLVGSKLFIELAPPHVVARHMREIRTRDGLILAEGQGEGEAQELEDAIVIDAERVVVVPPVEEPEA